MTRRPLSELDDWELVYDDQDIRGRRLVDESGTPIGTVSEMIVDTEEERVDAIVLDNGVEYPARDFRIRDGRPVLFQAPAELPREELRGEAQTIPLREEELRVRKRTVPAGAVEIGKEVVTEQRTIDVPVTREEVVIERHPVEGRQVSDRPIGEGETIRVPVREEEVTVEKRPVVTEEIGIGKRAIAETEEVSGTVRREVAEVEAEGDIDVDERRRP